MSGEKNNLGLLSFVASSCLAFLRLHPLEGVLFESSGVETDIFLFDMAANPGGEKKLWRSKLVRTESPHDMVQLYHDMVTNELPGENDFFHQLWHLKCNDRAQVLASIRKLDALYRQESTAEVRARIRLVLDDTVRRREEACDKCNTCVDKGVNLCSGIAFLCLLFLCLK